MKLIYLFALTLPVFLAGCASGEHHDRSAQNAANTPSYALYSDHDFYQKGYYK